MQQMALLGSAHVLFSKRSGCRRVAVRTDCNIVINPIIIIIIAMIKCLVLRGHPDMRAIRKKLTVR